MNESVRMNVRAGALHYATAMPISGAVHAINCRSISAETFERPENFFATLAGWGCAADCTDCARTVSAQRRVALCVPVVRDIPRTCTDAINAIRTRGGSKKIVFR
ncbi:hypothetical protein KZJ38_18635 [Paraburkholderia edwinii]|jgi:hypothetical protein|uniref:Uncharacterized protein n=1 Tax=Paraburkholderia edwinii TaxID=2861782 RepID=A0ABX8ULU7_9BURK|nr:hypothetical protein [Paraburkholderia edwinii]QYD68255.1 hypothetical protein KZJ38_18635 [Paraburkholderia edwinii]